MNRTYIVAVAAAVLLVASAAAAEVQTREIEYKEGEAVLQGLMAWDDASKGLRPGVLVVHEWWGHNEHARYQAKRLAEAGYVGFALDMYGKGKVTTHPKDAQGFMAEVKKDPAVIPARFHAALELLKQDPHVSADHIAAIGYCFGGSVVLGEARSGADLDAVVSFHGALAIRHVDAGSCNGCELEITGLTSPVYDSERFGVHFVASPRHADVLLVTPVYGSREAPIEGITGALVADAADPGQALRVAGLAGLEEPRLDPVRLECLRN